MKYVNLNEKVRESLSAVKYSAVVKETGLPNTVILKFLKNNDKKLTIETMEKLITGLGFELDIKIIDNQGAEVSWDKVNEKIKKIAGGDAKTPGKKALEIISGAKPVSVEESEENNSIEMDLGTSTQEETKAPEEPVAAAKNEQQSTQAPGYINIPDIELDLDNIFLR